MSIKCVYVYGCKQCSSTRTYWELIVGKNEEEEKNTHISSKFIKGNEVHMPIDLPNWINCIDFPVSIESCHNRLPSKEKWTLKEENTNKILAKNIAEDGESIQRRIWE